MLQLPDEPPNLPRLHVLTGTRRGLVLLFLELLRRLGQLLVLRWIPLFFGQLLCGQRAWVLLQCGLPRSQLGL